MGINFLTVRDKRKKVYGYAREPERTVSYVINNISKSFDLNSIQTSRNFYLIRQANGLLDGENIITYGEYDEGYLVFDGSSVSTISFATTFTSTPIVTLVVEQNSTADQNINATIANISTTQLVVSASAPIHGNIRYQAIYASSYPTIVIRNTISSSQTYYAYAGYQDLIITDLFSFSYTGLGTPSNVFITTYDNIGNGSVSVAVTATSSYSETIVTGSFSAKITGRVNFMAIQ